MSNQTDGTKTEDTIGRKPLVTIITAAFKEVENLPVLYERLAAITDTLPQYRFKILIIDDCSSDGTPELIEKLAGKDSRVSGLRLARNSGSHAATMAGMSVAEGDCIISMAADLQDPPDIIPELLEEWRKGAKIVWAVRRKRRGHTGINALLSRMYWYVLCKLLTSTPPEGADFFLADRVVVDAFNKLQEHNSSVLSMLSWLGFKQSYIPYEKQSRLHGTSKWNFNMKFLLMINTIIAYTYLPIRLMTLVGILLFVILFLYIISIVISAIHGNPIKGWSSLMVVVLFIGGVQMLMLGILGEYLWRTLEEARRRPRFVIEKKIE